MTVTTISDQDIPWVAWDTLQRKMAEIWQPQDNPHISIIGKTGSGKTYLTCNGILPLVQYDHVLIIDIKRDDPVLCKIGKPVKEIPRHEFSVKRLWDGKDTEHEARSTWYRLLVPDNVQQARKIVYNSIQRCYEEGNWIIYADELRHLTAKQEPFLNLSPLIEHVYTKGRSRNVVLVAGSQEPKWLPSSFYSQASQVFIGRIRDEDTQKRLREIGGLTKGHLPIISSLMPREWLYVAPDKDMGEYYARSIVGMKGGKPRAARNSTRNSNR